SPFTGLAILVYDASAWLNPAVTGGTTQLGVHNGELALLVPGATPGYALFGTGEAVLDVAGVGSVTGTFTVRKNTLGVDIADQTFAYGPVSVKVTELHDGIESITDEDVTVELEGFVTIAGDFAVIQGADAPSPFTGLAILVDDASATLNPAVTG